MTRDAKATGLMGPEASTSAVYSAALAEIKERIRVERQSAKGWGKGIVQQLAEDLQREFPGTGGFSASNLWRMKGFFETYRDAVKLAPLARGIGWSAGPENLYAEAVWLAAVIKRNFEELGI